MQPPKPMQPQGAGFKTTDPQLGHETRDINVTGVVAFVVALMFSGIVIFVVLLGVFHFATRYGQEQDARDLRDPWIRNAETQVAKEADKLRPKGNRVQEPGAMEMVDAQSRIRVSRFPQPRLQNDDVYDLTVMREAENIYLNRYFVLDKNSGKVNIPIEQAMQMVVQKGLPAMQNQRGVQKPATAESTGIVDTSIESSHSKDRGGVR